MLHRLSMKVIYVARRFLFRTRLGKTQFAARVYAMLFELTSPDLTKPIAFRNVSLYVDPADRSCVPSIVGGYFEETELTVFEHLINYASVFVDIGANVGVYSLIGCTKSDTLIAYAFEPVAENVNLLEKNIAIHGLEERILVQPCAVSNLTGRARIRLEHSGTHSLEHGRGTLTRDIATVNLDEFIFARRLVPDLMKIDVEGHEGAVIAGALRTLSEHSPTVFIEYIPAAHKDVEGLVHHFGSLFDTCFVIDEITHAVTETVPSKLDRQRGCNLILTTNLEHAEQIRRFVTS